MVSLLEAVEQAQQGDRTAFEAVFETFADPLFRYLLAHCGDPVVAEELTTVLWVQVVEHLPSFRSGTGASDRSFAAWLYRLARDVLIDHFRRIDQQPVSIDAELPAGAPSPEDTSPSHEAHEELNAAFAQLTPEQREVLLLRFIEGRSPDEVAQLTQRSEEAIRALQFRALGTLAQFLEQR